jgi:transposase
VARRHQALSEEIAELDAQLERLVAQAAPGFVSLPGVGTNHAATLLVLAGDNPERLKSEASFASLCGVSPVEASSGEVEMRVHAQDHLGYGVLALRVGGRHVGPSRLVVD